MELTQKTDVSLVTAQDVVDDVIRKLAPDIWKIEVLKHKHSFSFKTVRNSMQT